MRLLLLALLFLSAMGSVSAADGISSPVEFHPQKFDVLHYDATLDLTKAPSAVMKGTCITTIRWIDSTDVVYHFHLRGLAVDSAFLDSSRITPEAVQDTTNKTTHYDVIPPKKPRAGDTARLTVYYSGTMTSEPGNSPWGGVLSQSGTLYAMGVGFKAPYVSTTQHWLPCYDHPSDKATFHGVFRVPKGYFAASNGTLQQREEGDTTICEWTHNIPCATYLLTFAVDKYLPLSFSTSVPAVVYSRSADTAATRISFSRLPEMVRCLEQHFIPFPFEKVGYVNTPNGAMEHQTMISFNTSLSQSKNTTNSVAAHELAHQWFGDLVSPLDFRNAWLTESFATFCESLWAECAGTSGGYLKDQSNKLSQYLNTVVKTEGVLPLYDFSRTPPSSNYPGTIYQKGAVVVGMLRYELGDSLFFGGLREYLTRHKYSSAATTDLRLVLEQFSGKDLSWFFRQWVESPGWVMLTADTATVSVGNGLRNLQLRLKQVQPASYGTYTNVPVEIGFKKRVGGEYFYRIIRLNDTQQTFTLDSLPDFTTITINEGPSLRALLQITRISDVEEFTRPVKSAPLRVTPNPFSGSITATFEAGARNAIISVIDPAGKVVFTQDFETTAGENILTIPLPQLANGTYFFRVETGDDKFSVPVILRR